MSASAYRGSLSGAAASAKPRSLSCAATRLACPRWPPALSTWTRACSGDTGATSSRAFAPTTSPGDVPESGAGQATAVGAPESARTSVHVAAAAAASTATTTTHGPLRRRRYGGTCAPPSDGGVLPAITTRQPSACPVCRRRSEGWRTRPGSVSFHRGSVTPSGYPRRPSGLVPSAPRAARSQERAGCAAARWRPSGCDARHNLAGHKVCRCDVVQRHGDDT